eukprot:CAMPEP_0174746966 /NCGR_PEP_ID=MMETSP1094-20130205/90219_1 /TAXON_ID=156173 /ORGANISM="Chrysochromulina brevifilum, Strain UTEX LB 985" /LENGTH=90 /DNA_ID=CAMNT_0015951765 /DNA_START=682 /DNA_END=954 /DNA_ORIENTATION=-
MKLAKSSVCLASASETPAPCPCHAQLVQGVQLRRRQALSHRQPRRDEDAVRVDDHLAFRVVDHARGIHMRHVLGAVVARGVQRAVLSHAR